MSVIQPNLIIPIAYQIRLDTGELWRDGGVLRKTVNGTIAHILKDGPVFDNNSKALANSAESAVKSFDIGNFMKNNKGVTIAGIAGLVLTIGTGVYLYIVKKRNDKAIADASKKVTVFQSALSQYLKFAMSGEMTISDIDSLISALDALESDSPQDRIVLDFSAGELFDLVNCIIGYTKSLAAANSYELDDSISDESCTVVNLRHHLNAQKNIFEHAV